MQLYPTCTPPSKSLGRFQQLGRPLLLRLIVAWYWILQLAVAGRPYGLSSWPPPTVAPISFGGSFDTHLESATRSQEHLAPVRRLTAPRAPTTGPGPSDPPRAGGQPQRRTAPPPAPTSVRGGVAGGPPASEKHRQQPSRGSRATTVTWKRQ